MRKPMEIVTIDRDVAIAAQKQQLDPLKDAELTQELQNIDRDDAVDLQLIGQLTVEISRLREGLQSKIRTLLGGEEKLVTDASINETYPVPNTHSDDSKPTSTATS